MRLFIIPWMFTISTVWAQGNGAQPPSANLQPNQYAMDFYNLVQQNQRLMLNGGLLGNNMQNPLALPPHNLFHHNHPLPHQLFEHHHLGAVPQQPGNPLFDHLLHPAAFTNGDGSSTEATTAKPTVTTRELPSNTGVDSSTAVAMVPADSVVEVVQPSAPVHSLPAAEDARPLSPILPPLVMIAPSPPPLPPLPLVQIPEMESSSVESVTSSEIRQEAGEEQAIVAPLKRIDETSPHKSKEQRVRITEKPRDMKMFTVKLFPKSNISEVFDKPQETSIAATVEKPDDEGFQKLFKALNLSDTEKRDIVQHVEQLLKEEIAKKLSAGTSNSSTTTTPTTATTTEVPTTTTRLRAPSPVTKLPINTLRPMATLRVREQTDIRESQPKVGGVKLLGRDAEYENEEEVAEFVKLGNHGPLKTTDTHLGFPSVKTSEEDEERNHGKGLATKLNMRNGQDIPSIVDLYGQITVPSVTGAPLDLSEEAVDQPVYQTRAYPSMHAPVTQPPVATMKQIEISAPEVPISSPVQSRSRIHQPHVKTAFESLVNDYRQRLSGTDDVNKLLQNFYSNAYIALYEHKEPEIKRSPPRLGGPHPHRRADHARRR